MEVDEDRLGFNGLEEDMASLDLHLSLDEAETEEVTDNIRDETWHLSEEEFKKKYPEAYKKEPLESISPLNIIFL